MYYAVLQFAFRTDARVLSIDEYLKATILIFQHLICFRLVQESHTFVPLHSPKENTLSSSLLLLCSDFSTKLCFSNLRYQISSS